MVRKFFVGEVYDTPKGKIRILSMTPRKKLPDGKFKHPRAVIEFLETGTVISVQTTNIAAGKFRDYRKPTVYGVGYIGSDIVIPERGKDSIIRRLYDLWCNMLKRAYGGYKTCYIKGNVSVDIRWHNFTCFLNTIVDVPCYSLWEKNPSKYVLDKDVKATDHDNKVYSRDTCVFLPIEVSTYEASMRRWHGVNAFM